MLSFGFVKLSQIMQDARETTVAVQGIGIIWAEDPYTGSQYCPEFDLSLGHAALIMYDACKVMPNSEGVRVVLAENPLTGSEYRPEFSLGLFKSA